MRTTRILREPTASPQQSEGRRTGCAPQSLLCLANLANLLILEDMVVCIFIGIILGSISAYYAHKGGKTKKSSGGWFLVWLAGSCGYLVSASLAFFSVLLFDSGPDTQGAVGMGWLFFVVPFTPVAGLICCFVGALVKGGDQGSEPPHQYS